MTQSATLTLRPWSYQRIAPGSFRRVHYKIFEQWVHGKASLPPSDDGFVWLADVIVEMLDRQVVKIRDARFSKHRVNAEGVHEMEMRLEQESAELKPFWDHLYAASSEGREVPGPVKDTSHPSAQDQYRWTPTRADVDSLDNLVNKRAGRVVMKLGSPVEVWAGEPKASVSPPQPEETASSIPVKSRKPPTRAPRPFIAANAPTPFTASDSKKPPEETRALREKAGQMHHALLVALQQRLEYAKWIDIQELPNSFDLWARNPVDNCRVIFEAKTLDAASEVEQTRAALAQLLEYRYFYGECDDKLCLVTNATISDARQGFLASLGIAVLTYDGKAFHTVGTLAREWLGELAHALS